MHKKGRLTALACAATGVLLAATIVAGAAPAIAGQAKYLCLSDLYAAGLSVSGGVYTTKPDARRCGAVGARAIYRLYPGSPIYYAGWSYGSYQATSSPGNIILGGNHRVTAPGEPYKDNFPFTT